MLTIGLEVLWIAKCRYMPGQNVDTHSHNFFHYIYVIDGAGVININGTDYPFCRDNIYMVPQNTKHSFTIDPVHNMQAIEIKFNLHDKSMIETANRLPYCKQLDNSYVKRCLESILEEGIRKGQFYADIINVKFSDVLLNIIRKHLIERSDISSHISYAKEGGNDIFGQVISYMYDNLKSDISLKDLAGIINLDKVYFSKLFKARYGMSPIRFFNEIRLTKSKELLRYSDSNITQISCEMGFESLQYFSRFFSKREGISPYEYRQKYRNNIFIYVDENRRSKL